jgi:hypothetical protein
MQIRINATFCELKNSPYRKIPSFKQFQQSPKKKKASITAGFG